MVGSYFYSMIYMCDWINLTHDPVFWKQVCKESKPLPWPSGHVIFWKFECVKRRHWITFNSKFKWLYACMKVYLSYLKVNEIRCVIAKKTLKSHIISINKCHVILLLFDSSSFSPQTRHALLQDTFIKSGLISHSPCVAQTWHCQSLYVLTQSIQKSTIFNAYRE